MKNNMKEAIRLGSISLENRLSKSEAAKILNVDIVTIWRYIKSGTLSSIKIGNSKSSRVYLFKSEVCRLAGIQPHEYDPKK